MAERIYIHEDVAVRPGRVPDYLANQGSWWSFSEDYRYDLVGIFGQMRPAGRWPRAVNLWEADWRRLERVLDEQFGMPATRKPSDDKHNDWWRRSANHRASGWDRFMRPGPGSPAVAELQHGALRPCVLQQVVRLRLGAQAEYLQWVAERVAGVVQDSGWRALMWLGALHGSAATVLFGAPNWAGLPDLASLLPPPDPAWDAVVASLLRAWEGSALLRRG